MNKTYYNKLVRDNIPEIIKNKGSQFEIQEMSDEEYRGALREKLLEEAKEVFEAESDNLVTELADLYEVIDALMKFYNIDKNLVLKQQNMRKIERGGFTKRIKLIWINS